MRNFLLCRRHALRALAFAALGYNVFRLRHPRNRDDQGNKADQICEEGIVPADFSKIARNRRVNQVEQELNRDAKPQKARALLAFKQRDDSRISHREHHAQADAHDDARGNDERVIGDVRHEEREGAAERHHQDAEDSHRLEADLVKNSSRKHAHRHRHDTRDAVREHDGRDVGPHEMVRERGNRRRQNRKLAHRAEKRQNTDYVKGRKTLPLFGFHAYYPSS